MAGPLLADEDARLLFQAKRFAIATILYVRGETVMRDLRRETGLSWGDLDSNVRAMERRGLAKTRKIITREGPRTAVSLTPRGRRAYERLVNYLRRHLPGEA